MIKDFAKFNILDSKSIEDVKLYTNASANLSNLPKNTITTIDYFTIDEIKYANDWHDKHFKYDINHLGFRFKELPTEVDIAVFGCSFTFGIGLPEKYLWHHILSDILNLKSLNFGVPGTSAITAIELFLIVSKHINIKKAIFLMPSHNRLQIAKRHPITNEVNYIPVMATHNSNMCEFYGIDGRELFRYLPEEELLKQFKNIIYTAEYVSRDRNIETYYSSWDQNTYELLKNMDLYGKLLPNWKSESMEQANSDLARDRLHPGPLHHQNWANQIKDYIL